MAVRYFNDRIAYRLPRKRLTREWILASAAAEGWQVGEVSYVFCSAEGLLHMNRQYLGHDYYTDVITFDESDPEARIINGDIFIDVETVRSNAARFGSRPIDEMRRVIIHGMLHLCGYKDKTPRDEQAMHAREDHYLALWPESGKQ